MKQLMMVNRKKIVDELLPRNRFGCHFRLVQFDDAEFIVNLRNHEKLSRHINATSIKIDEQIDWLKDYKIREEKGEDFYIISLQEDKTTRLGLNRIYNTSAKKFEFGSWVYNPDAGSNMAVLGDLFTKSLAFEKLNFETCMFSSRKKNKRVLWYGKSFDPTLVGEDESNYHFELSYDNFKAQRDKLLKMFGIEQ